MESSGSHHIKVGKVKGDASTYTTGSGGLWAAVSWRKGELGTSGLEAGERSFWSGG